jgi:SAM-dependent methyltransferase
MSFDDVKRAAIFLSQGQFRRVWREVHVRIYLFTYELIFPFAVPFRRKHRPEARGLITLQTKHPVAYASPDHIAPKGTKENNSTNKKFVLHMDDKLHREFGPEALNVMDLGCSGGQMIADFLRLRWRGVGLEGSDFSLKFRRANWARLANINLFTCDITKPFQVFLEAAPVRFHLITSWEVLEHIATSELRMLFDNIIKHLHPGGYFIASTTSTSDIHEGIELHQTKWENYEWRAFVEKNYPDLEYVDVGLKIHQYVRWNFLHPSFLVYRRKSE